MTSLRVVRPGMLSTIQDEGRWGWQALGVPVAGPMDWYSHRLANLIVGNTVDAATLEITLIGPEVEAVDGTVACVVCGASFDLAVEGRAVPMNRSFEVAQGHRLRFGGRHGGTRAYLGVRGGIDVPGVFGSRATSLSSRMGPFDGRAVKAGDLLPTGMAAATVRPAGVPLALPAGGARVRVMLGPHDDRFTPKAVETLTRARFMVTPDSNRMGYRLAGPPLEQHSGADILSDATPIGSIQVPSSGQPILLMADRQTTGGYPKIGTVITADLPLVGQLGPGDWIEFEPCSRAEAVRAAQQREAALRGPA